jgi:hypothetical protein
MLYNTTNSKNQKIDKIKYHYGNDINKINKKQYYEIEKIK